LESSYIYRLNSKFQQRIMEITWSIWIFCSEVTTLKDLTSNLLLLWRSMDILTRGLAITSVAFSLVPNRGLGLSSVARHFGCRPLLKNSSGSANCG
jgi:hypothetical protein